MKQFPLKKTSSHAANSPQPITATAPILANSFERMLRIKQVISRVAKCRSSIYADIKAGTFPAPVKIGRQASAWLSSEIDAWIFQRIASRNDQGGAQ